jgi:hypothetical protein
MGVISPEYKRIWGSNKAISLTTYDLEITGDLEITFGDREIGGLGREITITAREITATYPRVRGSVLTPVSWSSGGKYRGWDGRSAVCAFPRSDLGGDTVI